MPDSIRTVHYPDSILVLANRYPLSIQSITNSVDLIRVREYDMISNYSVLELADILSPQIFVLEKRVVGFGVGPLGAGNVNIRGLGGKPNSGILVLINGRPDFMGLFGHPLPDVYGLNSIRQVEVIKGPSSTVFGSNAMGGVINLVTGKPVRDKIALKLQAGSYGTQIQNLDYSLKSGGTGMQFMVSHQATDGHIPASGFNGWNMTGQIYQSLGENWRASLEARYVPYEFDDPFMGADLAGLGRYGKIRRGMVDIGLEGPAGPLKNSFHLYTNLGHHRFNDGFESHDFTYGLSSYQSLNYSNRLQLSFGLDVLHYGGKARNVAIPAAPPQPELHTISTTGGYVVGYYTPSARLSLQAGLRLQIASIDFRKLSPSAGISFLPFPVLKLFTNYHEGFRLPTLQELYLFPISNQNLEAESVNSVEVGTVIFPGRAQNFQISWFYNQVQNIIQQTANPSPPPPAIFLNSGDAGQWGIESRITLSVFRNSESQFSYSYIDPNHLTAFNPAHMLKYYFRQNVSGFGISLFGKYISELYAENNRLSPLGDYHVMNLALSLRYRDWLFDLQFQNLLDREYEILPGYKAPGFHVLAGIMVEFPY